MRHGTMDELLALRAGEGSAWARDHVGSCAACQAELDALYQRIARLRALPPRRPARDRWPALRATLRAAQRGRRVRWSVWSVAAAAGITAFIALRPVWSNRLDAAELTRVKQQSAALEAELGRYDPDARVTSGRSAVLAAALEDRIAVIDGALEWSRAAQAPRPGDLIKLWQQRVDLMQRLVSVRVSRAAYEGL
jgi:hypothetical protein